MDGARFIPLPATPLLELHWEITDRGQLDDMALGRNVTDAIVKPVVVITEHLAELFNRQALKTLIESMGAKHCRTPIVHVVRKQITRDERHTTELPIEESLGLFADETHTSTAGPRVAYAAALAREADAGVVE